jgi:hypothetical protein
MSPADPGTAPSQGTLNLPGGRFRMGTEDRDGFPADSPGRSRAVAVRPFAIDPCGGWGCRVRTGVVPRALAAGPPLWTRTCPTATAYFNVAGSVREWCEETTGPPRASRVRQPTAVLTPLSAAV